MQPLMAIYLLKARNKTGTLDSQAAKDALTFDIENMMHAESLHLVLRLASISQAEEFSVYYCGAEDS